MNNDKIILLADSLGSEPEVVPVKPVNIPGEQGQPLRWPSNYVKWGNVVTFFCTKPYFSQNLSQVA